MIISDSGLLFWATLYIFLLLPSYIYLTCKTSNRTCRLILQHKINFLSVNDNLTRIAQQ